MSTGAAPLEISEAIASVVVPEDLQEVLVSAPPDVRERLTTLMESDSEAAEAMKPLHIIRPGIGRGKGRHLYEGDMLSRNATVFKGWRMYVDHLSESARKALGGLPRSVRDLGGRIVESWWDPNVPEDPARGFGKGAVVGVSRPVPYVKELIEHDPDLIEASIAARATGVSPRRVGGDTVWAVEGIEPKGSVDWVTEAGAGGKVVSLIEGLYEGDDHELLDSMSDEDVRQYLRTSRPELLVEGHTGNRQPAGNDNASEGDIDVVTIESLREALQTDEGQTLLEEMILPLVDLRANELLEQRLAGAIEEALEEERELLMIESRADAERQIQIRDMRDNAHRMISESRLPERFQQEAMERFTIHDGVPSPALDVLDELDGEGKVVTSASQLLAESVATEIERQRELLAAANPTRVRTPTAGRRRDADEGGSNGAGSATKSTGSPLTDAILQEAGFDGDSLDVVYG